MPMGDGRKQSGLPDQGWLAKFGKLAEEYDPEWFTLAGMCIYTLLVSRMVHGLQLRRKGRGMAGWEFAKYTVQDLVCGAIWLSEDKDPEHSFEVGDEGQWFPAIFPRAALDNNYKGSVPFHSVYEIGDTTPRSKWAHPSRLSHWMLPTPNSLSELPNNFLSEVPLGRLRPDECQEMDEKLINQPPPPWVRRQQAESQQHDAQSAAPAAVCTQHTDLGPPNQPTVASQSRPQNPQPGSESQPSQLPEQGTNTSGTPPNVGFRTVDGWLCP